MRIGCLKTDSPTILRRGEDMQMRNMRRLLVVMLALIAVSASNAIADPPALHLEAVLQIVHEKGGASLKVTLSNRSDEDFRLQRQPLQLLSINVSNEAGEDMPLTRFGQLWAIQRSVNIRRSQIPAKQSVQEIIPLSRIFDLTIDGQYTLIVHNPVGDQLLKADPTRFEVRDGLFSITSPEVGHKERRHKEGHPGSVENPE